MTLGLVAVGCSLLLSLRHVKALTVRPSECWAYFQKSANLALCYSAFSSDSSLRQAVRAGRAAFLCCAYDVVTDWRAFSPELLNVFRAILEKHATTDLADMAVSLYFKDKDRRLAQDGLERGSVAFVFVTRMMGSERYFIRRTNIKRLGTLLQIADDVLDYEEDLAAGDLNCLISSRRDEYLRMAISELSEEFVGVFPAKGFVLTYVIQQARRKAASLLGEPSFHEGLGVQLLE